MECVPLALAHLTVIQGMNAWSQFVLNRAVIVAQIVAMTVAQTVAQTAETVTVVVVDWNGGYT
jgi:hypothetical protein